MLLSLLVLLAETSKISKNCPIRRTSVILFVRAKSDGAVENSISKHRTSARMVWDSRVDVTLIFHVGKKNTEIS
jgi:hypothetical protein